MKHRSIEIIVSPPAPHYVGDGFRVHNFIPGGFRLDMQRMDPFLVLDYNSKFYFPPSETPKGVGTHPHKGFETVTIAYKGKIRHNDNSGGGGIIGEGDVQWMTAGSGILHKEFHEEGFSKQGGEFQMVQLWVNLSAENKKQAPKYQSIAKEQIKQFVLPNNAGTIEVIAGNYQGTEGAAQTFSPVELQNAKLKKGGKATFTFPNFYTAAALVIEGSILVNGTETAPTDHFVLFDTDEDSFEIEALEDAVVLILAGKPLREPIAAHGPFVMNTRNEIIEAIDDFNNGKFGVLA